MCTTARGGGVLVACPFHNSAHTEVIGVVDRLFQLMGEYGAGLVVGVGVGRRIRQGP